MSEIPRIMSEIPGKLVAFCVDEDCPKCGWPETGCLALDTLDNIPLSAYFPIANYCRKCGWIYPRIKGGKKVCRKWLAQFGKEPEVAK